MVKHARLLLIALIGIGIGLVQSYPRRFAYDLREDESDRGYDREELFQLVPLRRGPREAAVMQPRNDDVNESEEDDEDDMRRRVMVVPRSVVLGQQQVGPSRPQQPQMRLMQQIRPQPQQPHVSPFYNDNRPREAPVVPAAGPDMYSASSNYEPVAAETGNSNNGYDYVDYGAYTGGHGAFGWYSDHPVYVMSSGYN